MSDCMECLAIEDLKLRASEYFGAGDGSQIGKSLIIETKSAQAVLDASVGSVAMPSNYVTVENGGARILGINGRRRLFSYGGSKKCNKIQLNWLDTCQDFQPISCDDAEACDVTEGETLNDECRDETIDECVVFPFSIDEGELHCLEDDSFMERAGKGLAKLLKSADEYVGRFILDKVKDYVGDARYDDGGDGIGLDENGYVQIHPSLLDCNGDSVNCLVNYFTNMLRFNQANIGNTVLIGGSMFTQLETNSRLNVVNDNQRSQGLAFQNLPQIVTDVYNFQGAEKNCAYLIENRSLAFIGLNYYERTPTLIPASKDNNAMVATRISSPTLTLSAMIGGQRVPFEYDLVYSARCVSKKPITFKHTWNLSANFDMFNAPTCVDNVTGVYKLIKTCDAPLGVCEVTENLCESVEYTALPIDVSVANTITVPANVLSATGTGVVTPTITGATAEIRLGHAYGNVILTLGFAELQAGISIPDVPSGRYVIMYEVEVSATDGTNTVPCKKSLLTSFCIETCEPSELPTV